MASPLLLSAVASDLPDTALNALVLFGATSHLVVANHWDTHDDLINELGLQAPTNDLETIWRRAEALCAGRLREVTNAPIPRLTSHTTTTIATNVAPSRQKHPKRLPSFTACSHKINARKRAVLPEADTVTNASDIELTRATAVAEKIWLEATSYSTDIAKDLASAK